MEQISQSMEAGLPGNLEDAPRLATLRCAVSLILDVDGVLFEGNHILPGAVELISQLSREGTPYVYLSNNTTYSFQHHVDRLSRLGKSADPGVIITAARVTAQTLASESRPGACCLVIGECGLIEALELAGFEVTQTDYQKAEYVVIGMDRQLTYEKLKFASLAIRNGAQFISSNPDPNYPDGELVVPASGAVQAALEASTGVRARVTGKPALPGFRLALSILGTSPESTGMVGDQLEVDIRGGRCAGVLTFLVLSSLTPAFPPQESAILPDAIFDSAEELWQFWIRR